MPPLAVTYWTDPLCIWAYLAQDKVDRLVARFGTQVELRSRVVPVFGNLPARFASGPWAAAGPEGRAASTRKVATEHGHPEVSARGFVDDLPASSWAPGAVAEAVGMLEADGQVRHGASGEVLQALRKAFLVDDLNIARREVQRRVVEALELPWEAVALRLDDGSALAAVVQADEDRRAAKVQGSPTWVFDGGRAMLYGNVSEGVLQATVAELLAGAAAGCSDCGT